MSHYLMIGSTYRDIMSVWVPREEDLDTVRFLALRSFGGGDSWEPLEMERDRSPRRGPPTSRRFCFFKRLEIPLSAGTIVPEKENGVLWWKPDISMHCRIPTRDALRSETMSRFEWAGVQYANSRLALHPNVFGVAYRILWEDVDVEKSRERAMRPAKRADRKREHPKKINIKIQSSNGIGWHRRAALFREGWQCMRERGVG